MDYRGYRIEKHDSTTQMNYVRYTVVLGGIVWTHYTMPLAMAAIDKWEDED